MTMEMFGAGATGHFNDENDKVCDDDDAAAATVAAAAVAAIAILETGSTFAALVKAVLTSRR